MKNIFRVLVLLFLGLVTAIRGYAQKVDGKITFGLESEIMCFINQGYHGSVWVGYNGFRSRFVVAQSTYPDRLDPKGFKNLKSQFYEIEVDFFLGKRRKEYRGLWVASGFGLTKQSIESEITGLRGHANLFDWHSGVGYAIGIYKAIYINPWIGLDIHINPKNIYIGDEKWRPNIIDPVGGAKIGYSF